MKKNLFKRKIFLLFFEFIAFFVFASKANAVLFINEFSSDTSGTTSDPDWIEIYNNGQELVDLSLYRLRDNTLTNKLDLSGSLSPGSFITFGWSNKLNKTGDIIKLLLISDENNSIDQVAYGDVGNDVSAPQSGQSAGRKNDGENTWVIFSSTTKGNSNNGSIVITDAPTPTPFPTVIDTPTPTSNPTPVSTPTKTPTPKVTPTPKLTATLKPTATAKFSLTSSSKSPTPSKVLVVTVQKEIEQSKEVLGQKNTEINFLTKTPIASETPTIKTEVLGTSQNNILSKILIGLGSISIVACGILAIRAYRKRYEE